MIYNERETPGLYRFADHFSDAWNIFDANKDNYRDKKEDND